MKRVFADTSFYIALVNPNDVSHAKAVSYQRSIAVPIVTTQFVLMELGNWLASAGERGLFVRIADRLVNDRHTEIIDASARLFLEGFELYSQRSDKGWSLTDCTSFAVMANLGISDALTGDRHFQQAGFSALLR